MDEANFEENWVEKCIMDARFHSASLSKCGVGVSAK